MKKIYFLFLLSALLFSCKKGDKQEAMPPQSYEVYEIHTESVPLYEEFVGQVYGEKDICEAC